MQGSAEAAPRYTGKEAVYAVTTERNADLTPPKTLRMVYGPGGHHYGSYGLGPDCCWFTSSTAAESIDHWDVVKSQEDILRTQQQLREEFKGWTPVQAMLERQVAVMIKVRQQAVYRT